MTRAHLGITFLLLAELSLPAGGKGTRAPSIPPRIQTESRAYVVSRNQKPARKPSAETSEPRSNATAEADTKMLQGNWQVTRWEDETGEQVPAEELKQFTFHFEGDKLTMYKFKDDAGTKCQFRLDATKEPRWIDLGMPALEPGATVLEGIYSLEGDVLNLCITSGQRDGVAPPRPAEFKTGPGKKYAVLALKRIP